jgi:hypothetical protein
MLLVLVKVLVLVENKLYYELWLSLRTAAVVPERSGAMKRTKTPGQLLVTVWR